jgi:hypothetical protein
MRAPAFDVSSGKYALKQEQREVGYLPFFEIG